MTTYRMVAVCIAAFAVVFGINYLFALAGEPRSLWLMQVLGVI